ncbi:hypothetical protein P879_02311 [Paragonimus westermani]|uniref:Uncharacterized protein n=1 Tax=Paragonimus westermani TaxID=34504 RepID=A0A8T0D2V7_9TREM|nr:hypothetical protein P879_02311 [Paragonimus westermani]
MSIFLSHLYFQPSLLIGALKHVIQWSQTDKAQVNTPNQQSQFINDLINLDDQTDNVSADQDRTSINTRGPKPLISCVQSPKLTIDENKRQQPESIKVWSTCEVAFNLYSFYCQLSD